jgi:hypothetical protein
LDRQHTYHPHPAALLGDTTVACVGSDSLIRIYVIATGKGGLICDLDRGNRAQ